MVRTAPVLGACAVRSLVAEQDRLRVARTLAVAAGGQGVPARELVEEQRPARPRRHHGLDRLQRVGTAAGGVGGLPHPTHDRAVVEVLGGEAEQDPRAEAVQARGVVGRRPREPDGAVGEVLDVVVDRGEGLVLHPGGGALHEPEVLVDVVGELDRVEELVGRRDAHRVEEVGAAVLRPGVVVVQHAVAGQPVHRGGALGSAVAVEPDVAELGEVDVELAVGVAAVLADRRAVGQGLAGSRACGSRSSRRTSSSCGRTRRSWGCRRGRSRSGRSGWVRWSPSARTRGCRPGTTSGRAACRRT